ncbi:hypothetical protein ACXR2T_07860 [Leucobacter sp. HY1910]
MPEPTDLTVDPSIILTPIEIACGVTTEQVRALRPRVLIFDGGTAVAVSSTASPALATATARYALGREVAYDGFNDGFNVLGLAIYRAADAA